MLSAITNNHIYDFVGKEADKTTLLADLTAANNGSTFLAIDSKSIYIFDGDTLTWVFFASVTD